MKTLLFSGGQDSTTCLYLARQQGHVHALFFDYGQRHIKEKEAAQAIAKHARVCLEIVDLRDVFKGSSPLVSDNPIETYESADALPGGLENTFVAGRNLLFLAIAANRAHAYGSSAIVIGVSQADFGGYPDCRQGFLTSMERTILEGLDKGIAIEAPLINMNKAQTVKMAQTLPGCMEALALSWTCYKGASIPCGSCHACLLRARGFAQAGVVDPCV